MTAHMQAEPIVMPAPLDDEIPDWEAEALALFASGALVEPRPVVDRALRGDPAMVHLYCCDPDRAMCATDLSGGQHMPLGTPAECVVCVDLAGSPCGAWLCRLRGWLWRWGFTC